MNKKALNESCFALAGDVSTSEIPKPAVVSSLHSIHKDRFADSVALAAYVVYTSCSMFDCLSFKLTIIPVVGGIIAHTYIPFSISLMLVAIALRSWRWTIIGTLSVAVIAALFFLSGELSFMWAPFYCLLLLLAIQGMDYLRLMRCLMWELLIILTICLLCTKVFGVYEWWDMLDGEFVSGRGAYHPNVYSIMVFCLVLCIAFTVDRERFFWPLLVTVAAGAAFSHFIQSSDTTFILFIALALVLIVEQKCPRIASFICAPRFFFISLTTITVSVLLFVLCAVAFYSPDNQLAQFLDNLLHARIRLPSVVYQDYGSYPLFGKPLTIWTGSVSAARMNGVSMMMLDSAYPLYALRSGLTVVICIALLFCRSYYMLSKSNPSLLLWSSFVIMSLYMIMEFTPTFLCLNCTLLFLAKGLQPKTEQLLKASLW